MFLRLCMYIQVKYFIFKEDCFPSLFISVRKRITENWTRQQQATWPTGESNGEHRWVFTVFVLRLRCRGGLGGWQRFMITRRTGCRTIWSYKSGRKVIKVCLDVPSPATSSPPGQMPGTRIRTGILNSSKNTSNLWMLTFSWRQKRHHGNI